MAMTNEQSSPALIPGTIPDGLLPPVGCNGASTQEIYEQILAVTGVLIATGQRGPQGNQGPPGPAAEINFDATQYTLTSGAEQQTFALPVDRKPWQYIWTLVRPTDSVTPPASPTSIGYFSLVSGTNWRITFTEPIPEAGWILYQTLISTS